MKAIRFFVLVGAIFLVPNFTVIAEEISGPVELTKPGVYVLTNDVKSVSSAGIKISSGDVVIEGGGFEIFGVNAIYAVGDYTNIEIKNAILRSETSHQPTVFVTGLKNLKMSGCEIYGYDLFLKDVTGADISNNGFRNSVCYYTIYANNSSNISIHNNSYYDTWDGFYLVDISNSRFTGLEGNIFIDYSQGVDFDSCMVDFIQIEFSDSICGYNSTFTKRYIHESTNIFLGGEGVASVSEDILPTEFTLAQNHPNPFNSTTTIEFTLPVSNQVTLTIFNSLGRKVETLVDGEMEAGNHQVNFDASGLPSGIYLYILQADGQTFTNQMLLMK